MIYFDDLFMYFAFYRKNLYLSLLKKAKNLDYLGRIDNPSPLFRGYEGCYPVNAILRRLDIQSTDSILDIGCGKGLFLYYASKFPFKEIHGIDYSQPLCQIARQNIAILGDSRLSVDWKDARDFNDYDRYNYFFINNPFSESIMRIVANSLKESYNNNPRTITIIYQFPFNYAPFTDYDFQILWEKNPNLILRLK